MEVEDLECWIPALFLYIFYSESRRVRNFRYMSRQMGAYHSFRSNKYDLSRSIKILRKMIFTLQRVADCSI